MIYGLVIAIHVIASIVLILVILLQAGRGGGLSETFGLSSTQTFFGTSAAKFLQRATAVCAVTFLLTCLTLAMMSTNRSSSLMDQDKVKKVLDDLMKEQKRTGAEIPEAAGQKEASKPFEAAKTAEAPKADIAKPAAEAKPAEVAKPVEAATPVEAGKK